MYTSDKRGQVMKDKIELLVEGELNIECIDVDFQQLDPPDIFMILCYFN